MLEPPVPGPRPPGSAPASARRISAWLILALPILLGVFLAIVTPSYFLPMVTSGAGRWMLAIVVALEVAGFLLTRWGLNHFGSGPRRQAKQQIFMLLPMVFFVFPALWIILLGPALVVIMQARGST